MTPDGQPSERERQADADYANVRKKLGPVKIREKKKDARVIGKIGIIGHGTIAGLIEWIVKERPQRRTLYSPRDDGAMRYSAAVSINPEKVVMDPHNPVARPM
jgi:hypothetical protein